MSKRGPGRRARSDMPERIKAVACSLLITQGVRGFSYADIAERLSITTTNIHHHFGNKEALVDEVVSEYVADASRRHREIWTDGQLSLRQKIEKFVEFNFERYSKFNKGKKQGQPWSLIGRLRLDQQNLSKASNEWLASFTADMMSFIGTAVEQARSSGELTPDAPVDDIARILANAVNSTAIFTQVAGSFSNVREFFASAERVISIGYGAGASRSVPRG